MNFKMFDKVADILNPYLSLQDPTCGFCYIAQDCDDWQYYILGEGLQVEVRKINNIQRKFENPETKQEALQNLKELILGKNIAIVFARTTESNSHIFTLGIEYKTVNISQNFRFNHQNKNIQKWLNQTTRTYMKYDLGL